MKRLLLIDGNSLMFRSYYATSYTGNLMKTKEGLYTNAVYGFCNMINKLLEKEEYAFVAFDAGKQTFRHKMYDEYKGTRKPLPPELKEQIPLVKEYIDTIGVKRLEHLDYEADDLLATTSNILKESFDEILVVTGDHDLLQLVDDKISVGLTKKGVGELDIYTLENFKEKMGINPNQVVEYKGIVGDTSDNLPGIKGIGDKTAVKLLNDYNTIEGIYDNIEHLTKRNQTLFLQSKEIALKCRLLATLKKDAEILVTADSVKIKEKDNRKLIDFYTRMEFVSFIKKLKSEGTSEIKNVTIEKDFNMHGSGYVTYEIVGDNYTTCEFLGIGVVIDDKSYFISPIDLQRKEVIDYFENKQYVKYVYDYKGLYYILKSFNITLQGVFFDLLLATYLINPQYASDDFKTVSEHFKENDLPFYNVLFGSNTKLHKIDEKEYKSYILSKCHILKDIKDIVLKQVTDCELEYLLMIEIELSETLATMEHNGLKVDLDKLKQIGSDLDNKAKDVEKEIYLLSGHEFNINSPKQLGEVLFEKMHLPYKGKKKGRNGYQTNAEVLEKLSDEYEIASKILEYRAITKLINTYVNGLKEVTRNEFIHPLFKQALTNTGRLSSIEPNIQNMPIRTELGQTIREVFVSRFEDGVILSCDYSQIELRILAHMSGDENMINLFNSKVDIHKATAAQIYDVDINDVTKEMRRCAKAINFGIIYGMSPWGLSETLKITPMEASIFINKYFTNFPKARIALDNFIVFALENGYSKTLFGRRRYIQEITSSNSVLKQFGERTSMNTPIQGTAADIIKIAMVKVTRKMKEYNVKSKMIAQVHDELVFDCIKEELDLMKKIVKETMEEAVKLAIPLETTLECGKNWFEAK